jgi:recombination protein RecA
VGHVNPLIYQEILMDAQVKGTTVAKANPNPNATSAASAGADTEKAKALQAALAQIEKQFGKGTIMRLGEGEVIEDIQVVSTGSLGLDIALGVGGLPRGRVIEIYGPESSGKTTLTLQVIAEMQKLAGTCAFVDAEHALDIQYAQKLGVNLQELLISQPDTGEQALEIVDSLVRSGAVDLIVVDSVAALTPKAELEGEMGDSLPGLQARLMSQALRKLTAHIKKTNCTVIFINQIRMFEALCSVVGRFTKFSAPDFFCPVQFRGLELAGGLAHQGSVNTFGAQFMQDSTRP